ncbi:hypothetical protein BJP37_05900 [Moorena bouillonii PNG]|uniref:Secreted protein n=1 Tax=Moorena bouillonii PNG TaxID=568701 RepID=A0A1U7MYC9_9CYAN|nr:hypothetical protein BJP37_05900 [Moorena bouillonii PNG]
MVFFYWTIKLRSSLPLLAFAFCMQAFFCNSCVHNPNTTLQRFAIAVRYFRYGFLGSREQGLRSREQRIWEVGSGKWEEGKQSCVPDSYAKPYVGMVSLPANGLGAW